MDILDAYIMKRPDRQNVLDLFEGEWSSRMPEGSGLVSRPGDVVLFDDKRVKWAEGVFGGFRGLNVLELGPLEGGHTWMLHQGGAASIHAIEANSRAYLKCLCIKEIFELTQARFELGDFARYLKGAPARYDLVFACGVLYHMYNPVRILDLISRVTDRLFLWTHVYDAERLRSVHPDFEAKFGPPEGLAYGGEVYQAAWQHYGDSLEWGGFCGGGAPRSRWLTRKALMKALDRFGFRHTEIGFDEPDHPNGPALAVCAWK